MFNNSRDELNIDYSAYFVSKAIKIIYENYYYNDINVNELFHAAIKGMIDLLDEHSSYYKPELLSVNDHSLKETETILYFPLSEVIDENLHNLSKDTYIIKITIIDEIVANKFKCIINELLNKGIKNLVIDLRNNTGGYIEPCIEICKLLIRKGIMFSSCDKSKKFKYYCSNLENRLFNSIYVITNNKTMSAGELLAGALQDDGNLVLGQATYGKGVGQKTYKLFDEWRLQLTTEEFFRKDGTNINKVGIKPNIVLHDDDKEVYEMIIKELTIHLIESDSCNINNDKSELNYYENF